MADGVVKAGAVVEGAKQKKTRDIPALPFNGESLPDFPE